MVEILDLETYCWETAIITDNLEITSILTEFMAW